MSWLSILGLAGLVLLMNMFYLVWYQGWESRSTTGMAYYGKPLHQRRALKSRIRSLSLLALPLVKGFAFFNRKQSTMPTFHYEGVCGPPKVSSPEIFEKAKNYRPQPEDVFVATQMRCGTTWMQQIVYEVVQRGHGDLSDKGHGHLYAVSPWIDAGNSVSIEEAPLVGEIPIRLIKTHLPVSLCPYHEHSKYIYVTRHPVSCFASIIDFNRTMLGPLMPPMEAMVKWFCSERMYWLPWPKHVEGWWKWSTTRNNVLFIHFEYLKSNFQEALDVVAKFLGYQLTQDEKDRITYKTSFQYMKENEELFEMSPPNMFSVAAGQFLAKGGGGRHQDVSPDIRNQILDYCRNSLQGSSYPVARFYPDIPAAQEKKS